MSILSALNWYRAVARLSALELLFIDIDVE